MPAKMDKTLQIRVDEESKNALRFLANYHQTSVGAIIRMFALKEARQLRQSPETAKYEYV